RAATGVVNTPRRPNPAGHIEEGVGSEDAARMVARLIRVDHAGEVAAQALYEGQALTARSPERAAEFRAAAREEA
ncbi:MAG: demethoxyubiquinone hydroxylase family protein, partial [Gammaproteobacteria bacterium]